jgi:hypothetical protein
MGVLNIPAAILDAARTFFENRGAVGCEGIAMIAAAAGTATRLVIPDQRATRTPGGRVEVTAAGRLALVADLRSDEHYAARIHSHAGLAFHTPLEEADSAITHDGAISIVVPFFGLGLRHGLGACAVYVRRQQRWVALPPGPDRDRVVVVIA